MHKLSDYESSDFAMRYQSGRKVRKARAVKIAVMDISPLGEVNTVVSAFALR